MAAIRDFNKRVEARFAPRAGGKSQVYRDLVAGIECNNALHFGSGRDSRCIATSVTPCDHLVSLDPSYTSLEDNPSRDKVMGVGETLPFADDTFDLVCSEYVFEHLPKPHQALAEIDRVARPGGSVVLLVPNPQHYFARVSDTVPYELKGTLLTLLGKSRNQADLFPTHYNWGTVKDILNLPHNWIIEDFHSFPGPPSYTNNLVVHPLFVLLDRLTAGIPSHHVAFLVHYRANPPEHH